eukprot:2041606-Pleurochrysis_carterae.AAC.1
MRTIEREVRNGSGRSVVIQTLRYRIGGYACASARLATAVGEKRREVHSERTEIRPVAPA